MGEKQLKDKIKRRNANPPTEQLALIVKHTQVWRGSMGGRGMEEFWWKSRERPDLHKSQLSLNEAFRKAYFTEDVNDNRLHILTI